MPDDITATYRFDPATKKLLLYFSDQAEPDNEELAYYLYSTFVLDPEMKKKYDNLDKYDIAAIAEAAVPDLQRWLDEFPVGERAVLHKNTIEIISEIIALKILEDITRAPAD